MIPKEIQQFSQMVQSNIEKIIIGKSTEITIILSAFFAGKHVLLEDIPGTGKTMLAKALAKSFDLVFGRIQFTPDLLPADITGINMYNPKNNDFILKKGVVFSNILLADEINRATPRTQSALLECMEEAQVTIDGVTHKLSPPFFCIATQNPIETQGTFVLPEAQLDRFAIKLSLGYPQTSEFENILKGMNSSEKLSEMNSVCSCESLLKIQKSIANTFVDDDIVNYIVELAEKTRVHEKIALGVSVRGGIALLELCKAYAAISGRGFVIPDDVKILAPYVFSHRIICRGFSDNKLEIIKDILADTTVPVEKWDKKR